MNRVIVGVIFGVIGLMAAVGGGMMYIARRRGVQNIFPPHYAINENEWGKRE